MRTAFKQIDGHLMMQNCRRCNHRRINLAHQVSVRIQGRRMQLGSKAVASGRQRIDDANDLNIGHSGKLLGMKSAEAAATDDGDA